MAIKVTNIKPEFIDNRGFISRIIDQDKYPIRAVLYIQRKKGSVGGNHYHKHDAHFIYLLSGKMRYSEKNMNKKNSKVQSVILKPGDLVLSKPMVVHTQELLEDSIFFAFTTEKRNKKNYERDTVRINILK